MSSLINSASVYIAGDTPKKRVSTMRKTIKKKSGPFRVKMVRSTLLAQQISKIFRAI